LTLQPICTSFFLSSEYPERNEKQIPTGFFHLKRKNSADKTNNTGKNIKLARQWDVSD
jgi:hypothetical protein